MVEHQQGLLRAAGARRAHHRLPLHVADRLVAVPVAPARLSARVPARQVLGDRVARAERRDLRAERAGHHAAAAIAFVGGDRAGRQHLAERARRQAGGPGEFRPDAEQQGAAAAHVIGDVAQIHGRQDAAVLEAVQDDQVEFLDLDLEQLAHREGDQRKLVERRQIVLFGRAQDGEVHQVDRRDRPSAVAARCVRRHAARRRPAARAAGRARR